MEIVQTNLSSFIIKWSSFLNNQSLRNFQFIRLLFYFLLHIINGTEIERDRVREREGADIILMIYNTKMLIAQTMVNICTCNKILTHESCHFVPGERLQQVGLAFLRIGFCCRVPPTIYNPSQKIYIFDVSKSEFESNILIYRTPNIFSVNNRDSFFYFIVERQITALK